MDKTISISLGGFSFIIDEVAYNKLKKYLDQIRISWGNIEGVDEIMSDVEVRIAELFKDRLRSEEHTSELQSRGHLVCRLLLEKKKIVLKIRKGSNKLLLRH